MQTAFLVAGLAFGDEGKGATVDYLTRKFGAGLVVRYNGGSQAGHNVVDVAGRHHCFSQFGSGTFVPGVKTHLSRFMLVNPLNMFKEEEHLRELGITDAFERTSVDNRCLIITPFHRIVNRILERSRGDKAHGTCGEGVGQCRCFHFQYGDKVLFAKDLRTRGESVIKQKLNFILERAREIAVEIGSRPDELFETHGQIIDYCLDMYCRWPVKIVDHHHFTGLIALNPCVVFEGAQGVLLDEEIGIEPPYITWTDTTFANAYRLLDECQCVYHRQEIKRIGVLRSYFTRHGQGPFPTEDPKLKIPEIHNNGDGWQGKFRIGQFDSDLVKYAVRCCGGVDGIALNHLDCIPTHKRPQLIKLVEMIAKAPVIIKANGPTYKDRIWWTAEQ